MPPEPAASPARRMLFPASHAGQPLGSKVGGRGNDGELATVRIEILDWRSGRILDDGESHPEALDPAIGRGAREVEVDLDLVRADGHEQLLGREGLELVG